MKFKEYVRAKKVKKVAPNHHLAQGLKSSAHEDMEVIRAMPITQKGARLIIKSAYSVIRSYLESYLAEAGFKSYSHEAILQFCYEHDIITRTQYESLDAFRKLRHEIVYRGEPASIQEAEQILNHAEEILS